MVFHIPHDTSSSLVVIWRWFDELSGRGRYLVVFSVVNHVNLGLTHVEGHLSDVIVCVLGNVSVVVLDQFLNTALSEAYTLVVFAIIVRQHNNRLMDKSCPDILP